MARTLGSVVIGLLASALVIAGFASAGKRLEKVDQESETGKGDVGFVIGASKSPTKKFVFEVTSRPKGVSVVLAGQILCAPKKGDKAKTAPVNVTRTTPYRLTVKPTIKRNRFCDTTVPVNAHGLERRTTITGKIFHKR